MIPLFEDSPVKTNYDFSKFHQVVSLLQDFLVDYPRNKIQAMYFTSMTMAAGVVGVYLKAISPEDKSLLDDILGYIDIPAGMEGFRCDITNAGSISWLLIYDPSKMNPQTVKSLRIQAVGKIG